MNNELELRILDVDIDESIGKLEEIGAEKIGDWYYKRYVYDTKPCDDDKWIRLRTNGIETTLTYKEYNNESIDGVKELEIVVSDLEDTIKMLEVLGYTPRSIQENKRIRYMYEGVEIDIDSWPYLNPYIEVEAKTKEDVERVVEILKPLGSKVTALNNQSIYREKGFTKEQLNNLKFEGDDKSE